MKKVDNFEIFEIFDKYRYRKDKFSRAGGVVSFLATLKIACARNLKGY